jgi:pimeloyl-ACP methyl ester carboxylesterase
LDSKTHMNSTHESNRSSNQTFVRKAGRMILTILILLLAFILILFGLLEYWSYPGKPAPFLDEDGAPLPNSVSEKIFVDINGVKQGMIIRGRDLNNPILLYVHGGMPDTFLNQRYPNDLETVFTVVWWEQRGAGLSYNPHTSREMLTSEQMVSDTLAVTNYLRRRFNRDRIYLMGHSGGSFIGIQAAAQAPELYYAYIGMAQMSDQFKSERLAYQYMLEEFKKNGNARMVRRLESAPVTADEVPDAYLAVRDVAMHSLGIGTMHNMRLVERDLFLESFRYRGYTLKEKVNFWRAKFSSGVSSLWKENISTNLSQAVPKLEIPVYFLEGIYDYTCSYTEAEAYFERLNAPVKGFYTFDHSAHSPLFEEPGRTMQILREDVLSGRNTLAD